MTVISGTAGADILFGGIGNDGFASVGGDSQHFPYDTGFDQGDRIGCEIKRDQSGIGSKVATSAAGANHNGIGHARQCDGSTCGTGAGVDG